VAEGVSAARLLPAGVCGPALCRAFLWLDAIFRSDVMASLAISAAAWCRRYCQAAPSACPLPGTCETFLTRQPVRGTSAEEVGQYLAIMSDLLRHSVAPALR